MELQNQTLGDIAAKYPESIPILEKYNLDYCCGGKTSLVLACSEKGIDVKKILAEIKQQSEGKNQYKDWSREPIEELVEHIISHYHKSLRTELPLLIQLANKVKRVHQSKKEYPDGLVKLLETIRDAIYVHLDKEEYILFPLILSGQKEQAMMPARVLIEEHKDHGKNLEKLRLLTDGFKIPDCACTSWKSLYERLQSLEHELMEHIHLENNILFPRACREDKRKETEIQAI